MLHLATHSNSNLVRTIPQDLLLMLYPKHVPWYNLFQPQTGLVAVGLLLKVVQGKILANMVFHLGAWADLQQENPKEKLLPQEFTKNGWWF